MDQVDRLGRGSLLPLVYFVHGVHSVHFVHSCAERNPVCEVLHLVTLRPPPRKSGRPSSGLSPVDGQALSAAAVGWFRRHGRDLPWRHTTDPYAILVSELMLQQTTVATVLGYYERFLTRFPTASALAEADEQEVLAAWAGLGYYRRARLLQAAARAVVSEYGGEFPRDLQHLQKLPGVGRYTAGAVASFAFDQPAPIIEANTARLNARLFGIEGQLSDSGVQRRLWEAAVELLPAEGGRDHNSALMEIGALICTPARPDCPSCPVAEWCAARREGLVEKIPAPALKPEKLRRAFAGAVVRAGERYLIRRIPPGEWHAGMYEFPKAPVEPGASPEVLREALEALLAPHGELLTLEPFAQFRYTVTRHAVTLDVWQGRISLPGQKSRRNPLPAGEFDWMTLPEIARLPMGSAQRRLLRLLADPDDDLFGSADLI